MKTTQPGRRPGSLGFHLSSPKSCNGYEASRPIRRCPQITQIDADMEHLSVSICVICGPFSEDIRGVVAAVILVALPSQRKFPLLVTEPSPCPYASTSDPGAPRRLVDLKQAVVASTF